MVSEAICRLESDFYKVHSFFLRRIAVRDTKRPKKSVRICRVVYVVKHKNHCSRRSSNTKRFLVPKSDFSRQNAPCAGNYDAEFPKNSVFRF